VKNEKEKFKTEFKKRIYYWILRLIKFTDTLPKDISSKIIASQLIDSGTGVGSNYIEAQAGSSKKDFANYLHISLKCANESKFWLAILQDLQKGDQKEIDWLIKEMMEIANILGASLLTVKGRR
jgi:four helix bundle protein